MGLNNYLKIGNRIKEIRKNRGFSQKYVAEELLNIPVSTYSNYENDNRVPNNDMIKKIAAALDVEVYEILGLNETSPSELLDIANELKIPPWEMLGINEREFVNAVQDPTIKENYKKIFGDEFLESYIQIAESLIFQHDYMKENNITDFDINTLGHFISDNIKHLQNQVKSSWPGSYVDNEIVLKSIIIDWFARYYAELSTGKSDLLKVFRILEEESKGLQIDESRQPEEVFVKLLNQYKEDNKRKVNPEEGE